MDKEAKPEQAPEEATPERKDENTTSAFLLADNGFAYYLSPNKDQVTSSHEEIASKPEEAVLEQASAPNLIFNYRKYSDNYDLSSRYEISMDKDQVKVVAIKVEQVPVETAPKGPAAETEYYRCYLDEHGSPRHERFFPGKEQTKAAAPEQTEEGAPEQPKEPEKIPNGTEEAPFEQGTILQMAYCHRGYLDETVSVCCGPILDIGHAKLAALEQPREPKELKEMSNEVPDTVPRRLVTPDIITDSPPRVAYPELRRWNTSICHSPEPNGDEQPIQESFIEDDFAGDENRECSDASGEYFEATLNEEEEEDKQHREPGIVFEERSKAGMTEIDEWKELVAVAILNLGAEILVPGSFDYEKLVEQSNKLQDKRSTPDLLFVMTRVVAERAVTYGAPIDHRLAALCHFMLMGMNK